MIFKQLNECYSPRLYSYYLSFDVQVDGASASGAVGSGLIPSRVKLVFTASLLDA